MGLAYLLFTACAGRSVRPPVVVPPPVASPIPGADEVAEGEKPEEESKEGSPALWEVPSEDWLTQRLFRARFNTPEGSGRFKLTLHFANPEQFQITATDPLGRSLWSLYLAESEALLLEHRDKRACSFDGDLDLSSLYLGSFPVRSLPGLLLGRLPASPDGGARWSQGADPRTLTFEDEAARRWTALLEPVTGEVLASWSVTEPSGVLRAELKREEEWWVLLDRRQDLELRWREVVSEPLAGPVEIPPIPSRYEEGDCLVRSP